MPILIIYIGNTDAKCGFCGLWFVLFVHHFLTTHTCARIPYIRAHIPSHMATVLQPSAVNSSGSGDGTVRLWDTTTYKLLCTIQIEMAPPPETEAVAEAATEAATAGAAATEGGGEGGDGSSGAAAAGGGGGGGAAAATKEAGAGAGEAAPERWRKSSKPKNALLRTVLSSYVQKFIPPAFII